MNQPNDAHIRIPLLEEEYDDLDLPMLDIAVILQVLGDRFDIDPTHILEHIDTEFDDRDSTLMRDFIYEAIESSTQIPHIIRAIAIFEELKSLD